MLFLLKQEIGKAKTERKKEQAKASMKSFSTMVKYCEEAKCRHRVFRYLCTIPHGFGEKVILVFFDTQWLSEGNFKTAGPMMANDSLAERRGLDASS